MLYEEPHDGALFVGRGRQLLFLAAFRSGFSLKISRTALAAVSDRKALLSTEELETRNRG
ncbi:hypothetical protein DSM3645_00825 [Blastopirellula marina DSM 3645]|uniref:Uncharacterized protein n=1 Tax=Blastopirellula marina DSM 3645 TaxID=314230 RepID=A3ZMP0_9BACT|nr:hypothetical protein DSM3645_00825 [Blastopirellula marina DSM 3645]